MSRSVLITQCLQRDFIEPVAAHEPLPNHLHVGREEAIRIMGDDPQVGPIGQLMWWARAQPADALDIIHIRDWHDDSDPLQADHLRMFGRHCIRGTPGAALVLGLDAEVAVRANEHLVDSIALTDFEGTELPEIMADLQARAADGPLRVGVVGVWTEAKVSYLLYDLKTRCNIDELATCSALTASASRVQHFNALEQLHKILGVRVFDSVGEFAEWLRPDSVEEAIRRDPPRFHTGVGLECPDLELGERDREVLAFLFRDSARVRLDPLAGGFSGALVFRATSADGMGHEQAPSVAKVGPRTLVGAERAAFERVETILGNNAPAIKRFVDLGERAGIKYSYAAMGRGGIETFKSLYESGAPLPRVERILHEVFGEILEPFYSAALYERLPLLEHYGFTPEWAGSVREKVSRVHGPGGDAPSLRLPDGTDVPSVVDFYTTFVPRHVGRSREYHFVSYVHGDLNGANILVDSRENVWLIDFFHTSRGHVLKDLLKLENDLLYIFTPIADEAVLGEALAMTRALVEVDDLRAPLPQRPPGVDSEALLRSWSVLRTLRSLGGELVREDRGPVQALVGLLRYAVHTMGFDESDEMQKRWALAAACLMAERIVSVADDNLEMRVDWVAGLPTAGRLGMTLCPGRRDHGRDLGADLDALRAQGVTRLYGLLTDQELDWAGVPDAGPAAEARGISYVRLPVHDQSVPTVAEARGLSREINEALVNGEDVVIHCMGGLGRTGTLGACVLIDQGLEASDAIERVRRARGPRAIESAAQEDFVRAYPR